MTEDVSPWVQGGVGTLAIVLLYRILTKLLAILDHKTVSNAELAKILKEVRDGTRDVAVSNKVIAASNMEIAESTKKQEAILVDFREVTTDLVSRASLPAGGRNEL